MGKQDFTLKAVQIHLTNQCNLRCKHCYLKAGNSSGDELTFAEWCRAIDNFPKSVTNIDLTGGEPLLLPWVGDLARYIKYKGIIPSLFTNGTLITPQTAEKIKDLFSHIFISIDGLEEDHNDFRGDVTAFRRTIDGIELLASSPLKIVINVTLRAQNISKISKIIEYLSTLNIDMIRISKVMPFGRSNEDFVFTAERLELLQRQFSSAMKQTSDTVDWDYDIEWHKNPKPMAHICGAAVNAVSIRPNGDVTACSTLADSNFIAGNLRKRSLEDIWLYPTSKAFVQLRNVRIEDITQNCPTNCPSIDFCSGGCRAVAYYNSGQLNSPEAFYCYLMSRGINAKEKLFCSECHNSCNQ